MATDPLVVELGRRLASTTHKMRALALQLREVKAERLLLQRELRQALDDADAPIADGAPMRPVVSIDGRPYIRSYAPGMDRPASAARDRAFDRWRKS